MSLQGTEWEVIAAAADWQARGRGSTLITVAETWGSSPRPIGSLMLVRDDGHCVGSVSSGCVEQDLIARLRADELMTSLPTGIAYGVDRDDAARYGLPCGGRLELVVEPLLDSDDLAGLRRRVEAGERVLRRLCRHSGRVSYQTADHGDRFACDTDELRRVFGPQWQLLLIGAGELARYTAQIALTLDYRVTVCDPRLDMTGDWSAPGVELVRTMPDDAVRALTSQGHAMVVTLAHDPRIDDLALIAALEQHSFYIGALGSRRNHATRCQRLASLGLPADQLQRIHAPVGLPLGDRTPAGIALAIMAEATAARTGVPTGLRQPA